MVYVKISNVSLSYAAGFAASFNLVNASTMLEPNTTKPQFGASACYMD